MSVNEIKNVPAERVAIKKQQMLNDGAERVEEIPQDDGRYTLIAHYPDS